MSRVLVTGGAGFIGSHVVDALRRYGHEPVIFDLRRSPWDHDVETIVGDLADTRALAAALESCDAVAHLAAAADVDQVTADPLAAEQVNVRGTASVLEAARRAGVGRVLYASTVWVYSDADADTVDEDTPLRPPAHLYTATKLAGELYCHSYQELYGVDYTILRFGIPYGPRARPAAVVPSMVARALAGEPLSIAGDGSQTRRFIYVEDIADGVARALAPVGANRTYNLVGDTDISIRQVAETVRATLGEVEIVHRPGRSADLRSIQVDGSRAADELGWRPTTGFDEGLARYVASMRQAASKGAEATPGRRWERAYAGRAARALAPLALLGLVVACVAAAGSIEAIADEAPVALFAMALGLPIAVATVHDWSPFARQVARLALLGVGLVCILLVVAPVRGAAEFHEHAAVSLSLAVSSLVGAGLTLGDGLVLWRPSPSSR